MTTTQVFGLRKYTFESAENIDLYHQALDDVGCESAYYRYELLNSNQNDQQRLNYFLFTSEDGKVIAVMPFLLRNIHLNGEDTGYFDVSSPWGYNGPFFSSHLDQEGIMSFWTELDAWYKKNNVVTEFLRFNFFGNYKHYSGKAVHTLLNVKGDITDWDKFWSNLKSNTRNQFRKAEKSGLVFSIAHGNIDEKDIKDFYKVYIGTMDRRDAIDSFYHPESYFLNFAKANPSNLAVGLVHFNGIPISSEFFLISENTIYSFLGGTDSEFFKLRPNEFLKINAVKWAHERGMSYYMIGGGLSDGTEDKLYQYKKKYFPLDTDIDFYTGRKVIMPEVYKDLNFRAGKPQNDEITSGFFPRYRER
ncbi:GNAT family N-acetyltransferase [Maribacter algicola]|uniref:GNAT family N-acetyltransferase n=1 Tax=Maribacter algicola TaxID=2498892 RepID=A0A426RIQ2_9FLAO|nr:GNAT family N-acetyltransferase [Maribacter algicola]RRQ48853.1 GNAT family N-acetyltransferase [Maribacter algicola]